MKEEREEEEEEEISQCVLPVSSISALLSTSVCVRRVLCVLTVFSGFLLVYLFLPLSRSLYLHHHLIWTTRSKTKEKEKEEEEERLKLQTTDWTKEERRR